MTEIEYLVAERAGMFIEQGLSIAEADTRAREEMRKASARNWKRKRRVNVKESE